MIKRQEWDAAAAAAGDVTRRLRRVQELRRLLETEQGLFPATGTGLKHAQVSHDALQHSAESTTCMPHPLEAMMAIACCHCNLQEKLAASARAAKSRNISLLQAIADATDAKPRASASELDAQVGWLHPALGI